MSVTSHQEKDIPIIKQNLIYILQYNIKIESICPGQLAQFVGALSSTPKGCRFHPQSGHISGLWVQSQVGAHTGGN